MRTNVIALIYGLFLYCHIRTALKRSYKAHNLFYKAHNFSDKAHNFSDKGHNFHDKEPIFLLLLYNKHLFQGESAID